MEATNVPKLFDGPTDGSNKIINNEEKNCPNCKNSDSPIKSASTYDDDSRDSTIEKCYADKNETEDEAEKNLRSKIVEDDENGKESGAGDERLRSGDGGGEKASGEGGEKNVTSAPSSPAALAFTVDFGSNNEVDSARYQNLLQRYNARHRRNLSTSKIEIKAKNATISSTGHYSQRQKAPSTHSEGYFSSEDDTKRKADQLSQKLRDLGLKTTGKSQGATKKTDAMSRSYTEKSFKDISPIRCPDKFSTVENCRQNLSLDLNDRSKPSSSGFNNLQHSATMNDLSSGQKSIFDDERTNRSSYSPEKNYTKNIEYIEINRDYDDEQRSNVVAVDDSKKFSNVNYLSDDVESNEFLYSNAVDGRMEISSASFTADANLDVAGNMNLDIFNVSNADAGSDGTVSEAGTYTIHKDYTEEEKARMDIDKAFSVGVFTERESEENYVQRFKMTNSRDTNTWISEWATQVAEHNSLPPAVGGSTGRTPPMSPSKIPSPIYNRSQRLPRSRYEQSDSSLDMETHLHIKERLVNAPNQHNLIDSGGESDEDTSNSYVTPPHSSQRTPTHVSSIARRGSLSEALFKRSNVNECRRSVRKYAENKITKNDEVALQSPSHALARLHLERSSSLDRKEYTSDTAESNSSRKSSLKNYGDDDLKHTNSPILSRLRPSTPKLTNSPILAHKEIATKVINSPILDKAKRLIKSSAQGQNVGYFTCTENSPYMLRKSNSTSNYREEIFLHNRKDPSSNIGNVYQNSPIFQRNCNIQRSSSNASIRNTKLKSALTRRSSFNNNDVDRLTSSGKFNNAGSDSSSETCDRQTAATAPPVTSGIKMNRAFGARRGRPSCESDTTPNTTPEERRRKAQTEIKSAPCSGRLSSHHRGRTGSVGASNKDVFKKPEPPKPRAPSISRTDTGRFSMRAPKTSHAAPVTRPNQKPSKDHKKSTRSNSTLTSKEVEFQNWKRRKSYDPMKAAAEGKKKIDGPKKHHSIENESSSRDNSVLRSASFHGTRGTLSLADDWSDNEIEYNHKNHQAPPPCSPQMGSDSDLETSSYLQTTHNVMSAMSARINVYNPALVDSGGESDEDTSHSFRQGGNKMACEASDTETSDEPQAATQSPMTSTKYNRAFSLRRGRLEPQEIKSTSAATTKPKILPASSVKGKSETVPSISRTDSGRFSMRLPKSASNISKQKSKETKKPLPPNTREVELQNWKRRKSYDPMKAAMEGKLKAGLVKRTSNAVSSSSHVSRSQSFHGPATLGISEWSDEDISASADEAPIY